MKLLLASKENFLLEKGYDVLGIPRNEMRIGAINTAFKAGVDEGYIEYMRKYKEAMISSGIFFEEFDIKDKSKDEILNFFKDKNVVQVFGGNVFYLLKIVRETGFEEILKELLNKGLLYIGCSSGAYLMCPTVEIGGWKLDRNRHGLTDFTAFKYVPYLIKCHYFNEQENDVKEKAKNLKYPLRVLTNDQAILIEDGKETFIGDEEEVIL
jgi:dipeptidase E